MGDLLRFYDHSERVVNDHAVQVQIVSVISRVAMISCLHIFRWPLAICRRCFLSACAILFGKINYQWGSNEDGGVRTKNDTHQQRKRKTPQYFTAKDEQYHHSDERGQRGDKRTAHSFVDRAIGNFREVAAGFHVQPFSNSIKYHHRVIDRVANDGKNGSDKYLVDFVGIA